MIKASIYPRKSKANDNSDSMELQISASIDYLDSKYGKDNYIVEVYSGDYGITGHSIRKRKDFQKMMNNVKIGELNLVVIMRYDRIARNMRDFAIFITIWKKLDAILCLLVSR